MISVETLHAQIWHLIHVHPETKIGRIWHQPKKIGKLDQRIDGRKGGVVNGSSIATFFLLIVILPFLRQFLVINVKLFQCVTLTLQQLTNALLEIEEERAIWSAKEKAALLAIEEQARSNNEKITSLSTEVSEVRITALLIRVSLDRIFSKH